MNRMVFIFSWLFVGLVAAYDGYFAWQFRSVIRSWELNPVALWGAERFGLSAVLAFKFAALAFALGMAVYCRHRARRLERPLTFIISAAYGLLLLHYSLGYLQLEENYDDPTMQRAILTPPAR